MQFCATSEIARASVANYWSETGQKCPASTTNGRSCQRRKLRHSSITHGGSQLAALLLSAVVVFTACKQRCVAGVRRPGRIRGATDVVDGHRAQVAASAPFAPVSNPDAGVSDSTLLVKLRSELSVAQQDPNAYPSAWAAALGFPRDVQFGTPTTGSGSGTSGGYRVSPGQLQNWINELQSILDWANHRNQYINIIRESRPPAPDGSSTMANGAYVHTGAALQRSNDAIRQHAASLINAFKASLQAYQNTEQSNRDTLRGAGKAH